MKLLVAGSAVALARKQVEPLQNPGPQLPVHPLMTLAAAPPGRNENPLEVARAAGLMGLLGVDSMRDEHLTGSGLMLDYLRILCHLGGLFVEGEEHHEISRDLASCFSFLLSPYPRQHKTWLVSLKKPHWWELSRSLRGCHYNAAS